MKVAFEKRFCVFAVILFLLNCVPFDYYEESEILNVSTKQTMNSIFNNQTNNFEFYFDLEKNMSQSQDWLRGTFNLGDDLNNSTIFISYSDYSPATSTSSNSNEYGVMTFNLTNNQSLGSRTFNNGLNNYAYTVLQNGSLAYNAYSYSSGNNKWYTIDNTYQNLTPFESVQITGRLFNNIVSGENTTAIVDYNSYCSDIDQRTVCRGTETIQSVNYGYSQGSCAPWNQGGSGSIEREVLVNETMLFFQAAGSYSCYKKTILANPNNGTTNWIQETQNDNEFIFGYSDIHGLIIRNTTSNTWHARDVLTGNFTNQTFANNIYASNQDDVFDYVDSYGRWYFGNNIYDPLTGNYTQFPFVSGSGSVNPQGSLLDAGPGMSALVGYPNGTVALYIMDEDEDGVLSYPFAIPGDQCLGSPVILNWTDMDQDGCEDVVEDDDDDNDGILDSVDVCSVISTGPDYDLDGCQDFFDFDDDNDGRNDTIDDCPNGTIGWDSNNTILDYDSDGCNDQTEDSDDDNDYIPDLNDLCPTGSLNRSLNLNWTDNDIDGCDDIAEDLDDDNDGVLDLQDFWPFDRQAYGNDTDMDGLPDRIFLQNISISFYQASNTWSAPENLSAGGPSLVANHSYNAPLQNQTSTIVIPFSGSGNVSFNYSWNGTNCLFFAHLNGISLPLQFGNYTYQTSVVTGNHSLALGYYENISSGDCNPTNLQLFEYEVPLGTNTHKGLQEDFDDDNDGYSDFDEATGVCLSLSDPFDNTSTPPDVDYDLICDALDDDIDGDGFNNSNDAFQYDVNATIDSDNDGMPDVINGNSTTGLVEDMDDDDDGFNDSIDPWPLDECVGEDHDSDGLADNVVLGCQTNILEDGDDDNDNKLDQDDFCPTGKLNWLSGAVTDNDGDGCRDSDEDLDDDNDGLLDTVDLCPQGYVGWISNPSVDQDSDGCHDLIEDNDDDNDGVTEPGDQCPNTPANVTVDSQGCPIDTDSDGVADYLDNCANTPVGVVVDPNGCPVDTDDDGVPDYLDEFPLDPSETADSDDDGVGDNSDAFPNDASESLDSDGDGVGDNSDAFPNDANETMDADGDGVGDNSDAFPSDASETLDSDGDGVGDNSDAFPSDASETLDSDGDGAGDNSDAFPNDANETMDADGDGVGDNSDAFPNDASESLDSDGDGVGDNSDAFPNDANETMDADGDGVGDNSDKCSETALNQVVESDGCVEASASFADEIPTIAVGVSSLGIIAIATAVILLRRRKDEVDAKEFIEHTIEEFEPQESHQDFEETPLVEENVSEPKLGNPPIMNEGQKGDDGYYWLEWPEDSGKWYYRGLPGDEWSIWEN